MVKSGTDVFICGGGPAGLAAAIAVRQKGMRATVADCSCPPIDKACGEGLMPDSLAALGRLGVSLDQCDAGRFRGIRFLDSRHEASAEFPSGHGVGVRRTVLHQALVERAREAGVEMLWGARVAGIERESVHVDGARVRCRWIVGADGHNSRVRRWAGLEQGCESSRRIGLRRHFAIRPWSDHVEVYWGAHGQMYVTSIAPNESCVALLTRTPVASFENALQEFPKLRARLGTAPATTTVRGSATVTRTLRRVTSGNVALIGEASGSCDAITGEGLGMGFRQAIALVDALAGNNLPHYEQEHRKIARLPHWMARAMLLMDASAWLRSRALRAFESKPHLFQQLLALHVGEVSPARFGVGGALGLGWNLLVA